MILGTSYLSTPGSNSILPLEYAQAQADGLIPEGIALMISGGIAIKSNGSSYAGISGISYPYQIKEGSTDTTLRGSINAIIEGLVVAVRTPSGLTINEGDAAYVDANGLITNVQTTGGLIIGDFKDKTKYDTSCYDSKGNLVNDWAVIDVKVKASYNPAPAA